MTPQTAGVGGGAGVPHVAVVGPSEASAAQLEQARAVGAGLAQQGAVVITGGLGGVMEAASQGAAEAGGTTIGILPGTDRHAANRWVAIAIPTGLGELRNGLIVRAADALIAVGGAYGTLSEIALALRTNVPVVGLASWEIEGVEAADSPRKAVREALKLATCRRSNPPT